MKIRARFIRANRRPDYCWEQKWRSLKKSTWM